MSSPSRIARTIASLYADGSCSTTSASPCGRPSPGSPSPSCSALPSPSSFGGAKPLCKVLEPYIVVLNALPKIALGPLIIIWFGTGSEAIVFMTVLVGIIIAILHMLSAFIATDPNKILLMKSMGANKIQILLKLVLPSSYPSLISMLKVSVGMAWIGSIMGEYIVSRAGLGYLIGLRAGRCSSSTS